MLDKTLTTVAKNLDKDKNLGLAKTVLSRMIERKVRKLSDVYLTLGFAEISAKTDVKNVQQFFLNLIA
jgi:hypothetical protein